MRRMRVRQEVSGAHRKAVKALAIDVARRAVASGGNDGAVKVCPDWLFVVVVVCSAHLMARCCAQVWALDSSDGGLACVSHLPNLHPEKLFVNNNLAGSMVRVACTSEERPIEHRLST